MPAMPAPMIATSVAMSSSSGRGSPSGASCAIQGDRTGRSGNRPAVSESPATAAACSISGILLHRLRPFDEPAGDTT